MNIFSSIKKKTLLLLLIFAIVPTILLATYIYFSMRDTLITKASTQLTSIRLNKKLQTEEFFKDRLSEVNLFAKSEEIKKLFNEVFIDIKKTGEDDFYTLLGNKNYENMDFLNFIMQTGYYSYFAIVQNKFFVEGYIDKNKKEVKNISLNKLFNSKLESLWIRTSIWQRTVMQDFDLNESVNPSILYLASPIFDTQKKFLGMFVLGIKQTALQNLLRDGESDISIFQTEETYIVGRDYLIRSSSKNNLENLPKTKIPYRNVWDSFSYSNFVKQMEKYDENKVIASLGIMNIPFLNWSIISSVNIDEVLKPVYLIQQRVLFFLTLLTLLIILLAFYIAKKFTDPVMKLQTAVKGISEGDFNSIIEVSSNDEIGKLSKSFNQMVIDLKDSTEKLKEREQRLFHFYSATNDGIVLHKNKKPLLVNRTLSQITGFSREELLKIDVQNLFTEKRVSIINEIDSMIFETELIRNNSLNIPVEVQEKDIEFNGELVRASVIRDISRRKKIEEELESEKNKHLTSLLDGQELERQRLSRELHDGLGQSLIALQLRLQNLMNVNSKANGDSVEEAINSLDKIIEDIRRMSNDLMPVILNQFGLSEALNKLCISLNKHSKTKIEYSGKPLNKTLNSRELIYLYRIAQEALSNIIKYSNAESAIVKLEEGERSVFLSVFDNGIGIDNNKSKEGSGIFNMQERTKLLNGNFIINSAKDLGTKIIIEIPVM